jgi:DNA modification methylase
MVDDRAQAIIADSPWNLPADMISSKKSRGEFVQGSGEMTQEEFEQFSTVWKREAARAAVDGALLYSFIDWRGAFTLQKAATAAGLALVNQIIWNKLSGGMGSMYRSQYEVVLLFKIGGAPHVNNVALGRHGRNRTNVWDCRGYNGFRAGGRDALATHPTPKPVSLIADALLDCTRPGDVVLDPFSGSGSTLIAAQKLGRRARVMDLDPRYVDATLLRWERYAGREAVHAQTGLTFRELRHRRGEERRGAARVRARTQVH